MLDWDLHAPLTLKILSVWIERKKKITHGSLEEDTTKSEHSWYSVVKVKAFCFLSAMLKIVTEIIIPKFNSI